MLFYENDTNVFFADFAEIVINDKNKKEFLGIFDVEQKIDNEFKQYGSNIEYNIINTMYNLCVKNEDLEYAEIKINDIILIRNKKYIVKFIQFSITGVSDLKIFEDDDENYNYIILNN